MINIKLTHNTYIITFVNISRINSKNILQITSNLNRGLDKLDNEIILNFSGIRFIDSFSLQKLCDFINKNKMNKIRIINASDDVKEIINLNDKFHKIKI